MILLSSIAAASSLKRPDPDFSASIDAENGYLRPGHYTTCLDLIVGSKSFIGIGTTANPTLDLNHITDVDGEND